MGDDSSDDEVCYGPMAAPLTAKKRRIGEKSADPTWPRGPSERKSRRIGLAVLGNHEVAEGVFLNKWGRRCWRSNLGTHKSDNSFDLPRPRSTRNLLIVVRFRIGVKRTA